jgi:hypothetical protein
MGYLKIPNLYKEQAVLLFKRVYCLEKGHGSSANVAWSDNQIRLFCGGCKQDLFDAIFDREALKAKFIENGFLDKKVVIYGEGLGGRMQGMKDTYGPNLKFIAFEVKIYDCWLSVPQAEKIVKDMGLEFVPYVETSTDLKELDAQRDADSEIAIRNGMGPGKIREGIVIRPLIELTDNRGNRIIAKHKRDEFRETKTPRVINDPAKLKVLEDAESIAIEWVTEMRLNHVLQKIPGHSMEKMRDILTAMVDDILVEGKDEIIDSPAVRKAISTKTAQMYRASWGAKLQDS